MNPKTFLILVRWAFEEYLRFPMLEVLIASAIIGVLSQTSIILLFKYNYSSLYMGTTLLFLFLTFSISAVFSRGFAGSLSRGEDKLLLSYPVKRAHLFLSKFIAMAFTFFVVFFAAFSMNIYLNVLSPFEPMFYVALFVLFLQVLLVCAITVAISMVTKNEVVSILASVLLLFGIENLLGSTSYFSGEGRFRVIFAYFGRLIRGEAPFGLENLVVTTDDIIITISVPLLVSTVLLVASFVYFTRFMEVD